MGHAHHTQRSSAMAAAAAAVAAARGGPCPGLLFQIEWIITISLWILLETRQWKKKWLKWFKRFKRFEGFKWDCRLHHYQPYRLPKSIPFLILYFSSISFLLINFENWDRQMEGQMIRHTHLNVTWRSFHHWSFSRRPAWHDQHVSSAQRTGCQRRRRQWQQRLRQVEYNTTSLKTFLWLTIGKTIVVKCKVSLGFWNKEKNKHI